MLIAADRHNCLHRYVRRYRYRISSQVSIKSKYLPSFGYIPLNLSYSSVEGTLPIESMRPEKSDFPKNIYYQFTI